MEFWSTILAAITGGILTLSGLFLGKIYERRKEREGLRAALRAEIQAILVIVQRRDYITGLSNVIEAIKGGSTNLYEIRISKDYDIVFRSSCGKLGLLPADTAASTVGFYYLVSSIVEDLILLQNAHESADLRTRYGLDTQRGNLAFHQEILRFSIETVTLGNRLIQELA